MRVCFLVDYRGKLTKEDFFLAGAVVEFEPATAQALIDERRAVAFAEPAPPAITPALPKPPTPAPRKRQSSGGTL
jgi:hypothetical protein